MKIEMWQEQFDGKMKRFERRLQDAEKNFDKHIEKIYQTLGIDKTEKRRGGIIFQNTYLQNTIQP